MAETIGLPVLGFELRHHGNGLEAGGTATFQLLRQSGFRLTLGGGGIGRRAYRFLDGMADYRWLART